MLSGDNEAHHLVERQRFGCRALCSPVGQKVPLVDNSVFGEECRERLLERRVATREEDDALVALIDISCVDLRLQRAEAISECIGDC